MAERFRPLLLLPLAALVLHNLEELDKLPAWIDAHAPAWVDRDLYRSDRLALAMNLLTAATAAGLIPAALGAGCRRDGLAAATVGAIASNGALHVA